MWLHSLVPGSPMAAQVLLHDLWPTWFFVQVKGRAFKLADTGESLGTRPVVTCSHRFYNENIQLSSMPVKDNVNVLGPLCHLSSLSTLWSMFEYLSSWSINFTLVSKSYSTCNEIDACHNYPQWWRLIRRYIHSIQQLWKKWTVIYHI